MDAPRVVISGQCWRVIADTIDGPDGVPRTDYLIEVTDAQDRDLLGVQRWHQLTSKSAMSEWVIVARLFLDELLKTAGEEPNAVRSLRK